MSLLCMRAGFMAQQLQGLGVVLGRLQPAGVRLASGKSDPEHQDIKTPQAAAGSPYSAQPKHVPTEEELGSEKDVKWGVNIPTSGEQVKDEVKHAGEGLAQSVEAGVKSMLNKGKDFVEAATRSVGMESDRPVMSQEDMGAAGKMQHAPPGAKEGGPVGNVRAKYDEIKSTEAPHFPEGEGATEQWSRAGSYQNSPEAAAKLAATPEEQHAANVEIRREMQGQGGGSVGDMDESRDTGSGLAENLHKRGP